MSKEQVAWEMAQKIAEEEERKAHMNGLDKDKERHYWAALYAECAVVVKRAFPEEK